MSTNVELDQIDMFGFGDNTPPPPAMMTAPKKQPRNNIATPVDAPQTSGSVKFDLTGWYSNAETLSKLNEHLATLVPGDIWKNSQGVPSQYLGRTTTNHLLHQDAIGLHIYIRHGRINDTSPKKSYLPKYKAGDDPLFTLDSDNDHSSLPNYAPTPWYQLDDQRWNGRGRKPLWVARYLENGGDLQDILQTQKPIETEPNHSKLATS